MLSNYVEHTERERKRGRRRRGGGGRSSSSNTKMRDKRSKILSRSMKKINMLVHIV